MRVAMFSPLTPVKSALADITEGLLPLWAKHFDITMVISGNYQPSHHLFQPENPNAIKWITYAEFQRCSDEFDLIVYHVGDEAEIHGYMFDALFKYPGVVVLHDLVLHHAIVTLTLGKGNVDAYIAEMRYNYGERGIELAHQVIAGRGQDIVEHYPLAKRVIDASLGVIVYNDYAKREVQALRPDVPVRRVFYQYFLPRGFPEQVDATALRRELNLGDGPIVATFGFFVPDKRIGLTLRAFKRLLKRHPRAKYLLVGGHSPYYDLEGELRSAGLGDKVRLTGWMSAIPFVKHMFVPDLAVQLRYPHIGGTPYTPIRLMGLGVPTIVSDIEPLASLPKDGVIRIVPNRADEEAMLFAAMDYLLSRPDVAQAMAKAAQKYIAENHSVESIASHYVEFLYEIAAQKDELATRIPPSFTDPRWFDKTTSLKPAQIVGRSLAEMGVRQASNQLLRPIADALRGLTGGNHDR